MSGNQRIVAVEGIETPVAGGTAYRVRVTLDCGHVREPNPIYTYRAGNRYRCPICEEAQS